MARVSQAHLDARRQQILDGARRCFTRNGFHATSMQDVLNETDLSAGAVYRYFRGKDELIQAVAADAFEGMRQAFETAAHGTPLRPLDEVVSGVLGHAFAEQSARAGATDQRAFAQLVLQVWGETLRNEELAATLHAGYERMKGTWRELVRAYQDAGQLRDDLPAEHITRTLMAMAQGFIAQQALFGDASSEMLRNGLRALTTMKVE